MYQYTKSAVSSWLLGGGGSTGSSSHAANDGTITSTVTASRSSSSTNHHHHQRRHHPRATATNTTTTTTTTVGGADRSPNDHSNSTNNTSHTYDGRPSSSSSKMNKSIGSSSRGSKRSIRKGMAGNASNKTTNSNNNNNDSGKNHHRRTIPNNNRHRDVVATTGEKNINTSSSHSRNQKGKSSFFFSSHRQNNNHNNNQLHLDECSTGGGIEVSLSQQQQQDDENNMSPAQVSTTNTINGGYTVPHHQQQLHKSHKIYRAQFNPGSNNSNTGAAPPSKSSTPRHDPNGHPQSRHDNVSQAPNPALIMSSATNFQSRDHRIPLFTTSTHHHSDWSSSSSSSPTKSTSPTNHHYHHHPNSILSHDDALHLLRSYHVHDELTCVHEEIHNMNQEIIEINYDRHDIASILQEQQQQDPSSFYHHDSTSTGGDRIWDVHSQLLVRSSSSSSSSSSLTLEQRRQYQKERGCHFTVYLHDRPGGNHTTNAVMESLLSKCGSSNAVNFQSILGTNSFLSQIISLGSSPKHHPEDSTAVGRDDEERSHNDRVVHITTQSCREGGAGTTIQHLTLFRGCNNNNNTTNSSSSSSSNADTITTMSPASASFLLSRDNGPTYHYGSLPSQLHRRIEQEQMKITKTAHQKSPTYYMDNIIYLSTGPYGTYYVEFRNSEKWWGIISNNDNNNSNNTDSRIEKDDEEEFNTICYDWDIHRIAFGPCVIRSCSTNRNDDAAKSSRVLPTVSLSWIIISKDGKVAWKNLPPRLHNCLSNRIASDSTPCEVSLGANGSYFIRFMDGTSDWSLPAKTAQACQNLIHHGKTIMSMSLHSDLSHDFVIRHRDSSDK